MDQTVVIQLISVLSVGLLVAFWVWMFRDMSRNDALPDGAGGSLTWPPVSKSDWTLCFIVLSLFTAAYYYAYEYRKRH